MTVIRQWQGEGLGTGDLTISTAGVGDSVFSSINGGGVFTVTADGVRSPQITWPSDSGAHQVRWDALGDLSEWAVRRYFSVSMMPGATWGLLSGHTSTGSDLFRVELNSSGFLRYRSGSVAVYSPNSNAVEAGTVYRIEVIGQINGVSTVALYEGDSATALLQSTVTVTAGALNEIRFGHHNNMATTGETGDDFAVADRSEFIGPVEIGSPEPVTVEHKWQGDGLGTGALTTSSAGPGDTAFSNVVGSLTIEDAGLRAPRIRLPDAAQVKRAHWWPLHSSPLSQYAVRWYQTFGGHSPSEVMLTQGLVGGGGDKWSVRLAAGGYLRLRDDGTGTVRWTDTTVLPLTQPIRFELVMNGINATLSAYRGDRDILLGGVSTTLADTTIDELRFGTQTVTPTTGVTYDDIAFHSAAVAHGPAGEPGQVRTHFRYNGTAWLPQDVSLL